MRAGLTALEDERAGLVLERRFLREPPVSRWDLARARRVRCIVKALERRGLNALGVDVTLVGSLAPPPPAKSSAAMSTAAMSTAANSTAAMNTAANSTAANSTAANSTAAMSTAANVLVSVLPVQTVSRLTGMQPVIEHRRRIGAPPWHAQRRAAVRECGWLGELEDREIARRLGFSEALVARVRVERRRSAQRLG